jgi:chemotaxis protein MotB
MGGGGTWKVAYADFMTAMMAFFLVMWLLATAPEETLQGLAGYFTEGATYFTNAAAPGVSNNPIVQFVDKMDTRPSNLTEAEQADYAIIQSLRPILSMKDTIPNSSTGITSDGVGVLLHMTSNLMFEPNTVEFSENGKKALNSVLDMTRKFNVWIIVRGHADASETGAPNYPSRWELSSARANAAVRYLVANGADPKKIRSVGYADTRPLAPPTVPGAAAINSRVEFHFHRPEVMTNIVGY